METTKKIRRTSNAELKAYAKNRGVYLYEVAEEMGICPSALNNRLHKRLTEDEEAEFREVVDRISSRSEDDDYQGFDELYHEGMPNADLMAYAIDKGVPLGVISEYYGFEPDEIVAKMREPFDEKAALAFRAIVDLAFDKFDYFDCKECGIEVEED